MKTSRAEEFARRARELEKEGLEIEVIGRKDRFLDLRRKLALGLFLKSLVLTHRGHPLIISLIEAPELKGDHVSLGLALQIPFKPKGTTLSKADKSRLEAFLAAAIAESSRSGKVGLASSRPASRPQRRRASSGQ